MAPTPDGFRVQAGDFSEVFITAVAEAIGFDGREPPALLLIKPRHQEIDLLMESLLGMWQALSARGTLTLMKFRHRHKGICG